MRSGSTPLQNRNLSIRGMPKYGMPDRSWNLDIIDYMRLICTKNGMKYKIKNKLEGWSSLGLSWNGTSIRRAILKEIQPIMNFTHTNLPPAIEVLNETKSRQENETTMHFLGELAD